MKKFFALFLAIMLLTQTGNVVSAQDGCPKDEEGWICETVSESPVKGSTVGLSGHGLPVTTVYINGVFYYEDTLKDALFYIYGMGTEMVSVTTNDELIVEIGWSTNPIATSTPIVTNTPSSTSTPIVTNTPSSTSTPTVTVTPVSTATPAATATSISFVQEIVQKTQQSPTILIVGLLIIAAIVVVVILFARRKQKHH